MNNGVQRLRFFNPTILVLSLLAAATAVAAQSPKAVHDPKKAQPKAEISPLQKQMNDLKSANTADRRRAVEELGRLRDPHATPALIIALSDVDAVVRAGAARTLGLMRSGDAIKELCRIVKDDPDPQVTQSAAVSLGFIADPAAVDALVVALEKDHEGTRQAACQALAGIKSPAAVPALRKALQDPSLPLRRSAIQALGDIGDASAAPDLRPLVKDKDLSIQVAAVQSLGKLKDTDKTFTAAAKKFLGKKTPAELRVAAAQALARQGNPSGESVILDVLQDRSLEPRVRIQAAQALSETAQPSLLPTLNKIAGEEPEGYVKQALVSLAERLSAQQP